MSNDSRQDVAEVAAEEARPAPTPRESTPPEEGSAPEEVPAKPRRRLREAGKNLLTLTVSVVIALLLGEGGVRLFAPQQLVVRRTDVWLPVAGVGYKHAANIRTQANTGEQVVNIITDEDGYRVGLDGRKQAEHNILLLGDSYMEALQVEYADSVAGLLEERLSKKLGVPIGVRNTGVSGYSPSQYLIVAKEELAKAHFDLVVVALYMGNDIEETRTDFFPPKTATGREFRMPKNLGREELMSAIAAPMDQALEAQSELYILVRKGLDNTRKEAGLVSRLLPPYFFKADPARGCDVTAAIALDIAKAAQEKGAQPVLTCI